MAGVFINNGNDEGKQSKTRANAKLLLTRDTQLKISISSLSVLQVRVVSCHVFLDFSVTFFAFMVPTSFNRLQLQYMSIPNNLASVPFADQRTSSWATGLDLAPGSQYTN